MAKGRMLLNRISNSKKLADLKTDTARLLYTWLLSHLDANGCFYGDPDMVNNLVFTKLKKSTTEIASCLEDLNRVNLIIFYEKNGEKYLQFPDFTDKQINLRPDREGKSVIPKPKKEEFIPYSGVTPELLPPNIIEDKLIEVKLREAQNDNGKDARLPSLLPIVEEKKELAELCMKVNSKCGMRFNSFSWIQKNINLNPKTHIHVLKRLLETKDIRSPWSLANEIATIEDGNYNEAEHIARSEELKKTGPKSLQEALRGAIHGMSTEMQGLSED